MRLQDLDPPRRRDHHDRRDRHDHHGRLPGDELALVQRPRLVGLLERGGAAPLTVLAAPAGYGKSALADQWAASGRRRSAWLVLRRDDDEARVVARWVAALAELRGRAGSPGAAVLVVDALDAPVGGAGVAVLAELLTSVPAPLHVVVTCRSTQLAARLCSAAGPEARAVGPDELAFDAAEARLLVHRLAGLALADDQLATLLGRTGGWPVAVKVAAIALRAGGGPDDVLDGVHGGERHLAAFLREEVLGQLPPSARQFLVRTSVLDRLDPDACRAVAGPEADVTGRQLLERGDLPTWRPVPGRPAAHHPLFRDFLRRELRGWGPEAESEFLGRAGAWYAGRGEAEAAARCYLDGGWWDDVLALVDRAGPGLVDRGAADTALAWLDALPQHRRARVSVRRAHLLSALDDTRRAEQVLRELEGGELTPGEQVVVDTLRATWTFVHTSPAAAVRAADAALAALARPDLAAVPDVLGMTSVGELRAAATASRGRACWLGGDVAAGRELLQAATTEPGAAGPWAAHALGSLALLEAWDGDHAAARALARRAVAGAVGARGRPAAVEAHLALAHLAREAGDLARADYLLGEAAGACPPRRRATQAVHTIERGLWQLAHGRPDEGLEALAAGSVGAGAPLPPLLARRWAATEARLLLARGEVHRAGRLLASERCTWGPELAAVAVEAAVARRDLAAASALLDAWPARGAEERERLERQWWAAIVDFERGRRRPALHRAAGTVDVALAGGRRRLLLDAGEPARRLLRAVLRAAPSPALAELLEAVDRAPAAPWGLSPRELEVLRYLRRPLSSVEIASELYISLNTLKTHLRTIYRKLGVAGRDEAVRAAEEHEAA